jgi:hypothetical protein
MVHPIFPNARRRSLRCSARLRVAVAVLVGVLPLAGSAQVASAAGASTAYSPVDFSLRPISRGSRRKRIRTAQELRIFLAALCAR